MQVQGMLKRARYEQRMLDQLPKLPDLQCTWLVLLLWASSRAPAKPFEAQARDRAD